MPGCVRVHAGDSGAAVLEAAAQVRIGTAGADERLGLWPRRISAHRMRAGGDDSRSCEPEPARATTTPAPRPVTTATTSAAAASAARVGSDSRHAVGCGISCGVRRRLGVGRSIAGAPGPAAACTSGGRCRRRWRRLARPRREAADFRSQRPIGIALVVALAFGALWRSRGRRR